MPFVRRAPRAARVSVCLWGISVSVSSARRAARIADALLRSTALVGACQQRRWRIRALAHWSLAITEVGLERNPLAGELEALLGDRAGDRLLAGDLDPSLDLEARLDAVDALLFAGSRLDRAAAILRHGSDEVRARLLAEQPLIAGRLGPEMVLSAPGTRRAPLFVGSLARPGDADRYPASPALADACARRCFDEPRPDLARRVSEIARADARARGALALASYAMRVGDPLAIARSVRRGSGRDRVVMRLAIAALGLGRDGDLRRFAAALEGARARDVGALMRGVARLRRGRARAARRALATVAHPSLVEARDGWLRACNTALRLRVGVPRPAITLGRDPTDDWLTTSLLIVARHGFRKRPVTGVGLTGPRGATAIAAELHRAGLGEADLLGAGLHRRESSAWAAALLDLRVRRASRGDDPVSPRRLAIIVDALEAREPPADPLDRAVFDEVQALGARIRSRVAFCRAAGRIASSLADVESRVRALSLVGGEHSRRALVKLVSSCDVPAQITAALRALLIIDPRGAVEHILATGDLASLREAEALGALERGFAHRWCAVWAEADRRGRTRALGAAIDLYRQRCGRLPPAAWLADLGRAIETGEPERWSAEVDRAFAGRTAGEIAELLAGDGELLFRVMWTRSPVFGRSAPKWDLDRYRDICRRALDPARGAVRPGTVVRFARIAGGRPRSRDLAARLLRGVAPGSAALSTGDRTRLRFLDKRDHILEHLRFADAYGCCFTSSSDYYDCGCHATRDQLLALWRDPVSFACLAEARRGKRWEARGFVFGSFGIAGGAPVALLNGIYLRGQRRSHRERIIEALERDFVRLGVHRLAIANQHGGFGWLPGRYARDRILVERLRALVDRNRVPARDVYDDIGGPLNEPAWFDHLLWSPRLRRSSATMG